MTLVWDKPEESGNIADCGTLVDILDSGRVTFSIDAAQHISGHLYSIKAVSSGSGYIPPQIFREFAFTASPTAYHRFYVRFDSFVDSIGFARPNGTTDGLLRTPTVAEPWIHHNLGGSVVRNNTTTIATDTWYKVEIQATTTEIKVYVDDVLELTSTGTFGSATGLRLGMSYGQWYSTQGTINFDAIQVSTSPFATARAAFKLAVT